ncbi:MAG: DNA polymerase III subunit delta [Bacteroidales bacterium]|jgi:DNA polymerase-3 subunit delta|nr:DNA polymerase III subunit delta [Bacteroidales bacterium]
MAFTFEQIISEIRNKVYHPIYFLMGEEPYFIDTISDMLEEQVLDPADQAFNQMVVYGRDVDVETIVNQARNYPMTGDYQVLIVKEAQDIKQIDKLEEYIEKLPETTILVINYKYKKLDKRRALAKKVAARGVLFEAKKIYEDHVPKWIEQYLAQKNYAITPKACQMIADFLGNDLHKVRNELEKLMIALPAGKKINDEDVERNIGISKDYNIFELQKALGKKDVFRANQIIRFFGSNPKDYPLLLTAINLYGFFTRILKVHYAHDKSRNNLASLLGLNPFFVQDMQEAARNYNIADAVRCIGILREYDLKSKGYKSQDVGVDELYREMLFKLLH